MNGHHLTEIGLPADSSTFARLLGLVLDGPVCNQTPLGGQIRWVDIGGGHVGKRLTLMEVFLMPSYKTIRIAEFHGAYGPIRTERCACEWGLKSGNFQAYIEQKLYRNHQQTGR